MSVQYRRVGVTADLTVLVPRDGDGGLAEGTREVLERIDGVAVEEVDVTDLRPRLNDLAVEATVEVVVDVEGDDPAEAVASETLGDGFGVTVEGIDGVG
jgi:hypothetical protein